MTTGRPSSRPSILAIHPGALGDVILFGHLLLRLAGRVTLAAGGEKARLLAGARVVAGVLNFEAMPMHEVFGDRAPDECRLPAMLGRHDRLISCFGGGDSKAQGRLAAMCSCADAAFLPVRPPEGFRGHLLDLWSDLLGLPPLRGAGVRAWHIPPAWRKAARRELQKLGVPARRPYVIVHPGSGSPEKCWPLENFEELAARLTERAPGATVVFALGPVELERWDGQTIERLRGHLPVMLSAPLEVLAGVLASAAAYLGNDSGVSHLAAAAGTPTTALFASARKGHFAPLGEPVRTVARRVLDDIKVGDVLDEVRAFLPEVT